MTEQKTTFGNLKLGDAFRFPDLGGIYIRCRGGYRPCGGGLLQKMFASMPVVFVDFKE